MIARSRLDSWIVAKVVDRDEAVLVWLLQRTVFALCSFYGGQARAEILELVEPYLPAPGPWD